MAGLAFLVSAGTGLLLLPASSSGPPLTPAQALFTAVSALSTTGLSIITPGRDLSVFGQGVLLALMQAGGIGFIVGAVLVFDALGRRVTLEDRLALRDSLGIVSAASILRLTRLVVLSVLGIETAGAVVLWLIWTPRFGAGQALYYACWHAVSAFCNASFDLFSGSPDAPAGFPTDPATLLTIAGLVILGSLGVPVILDLVHWRVRRSLSLHTRVTLATAGCLLALGTAALFVGSGEAGTLFSEEPWPRRLLLAWFHSATSRTSGFVLQPLDSMAASNVLVLSCLMFIGGSPASMSGGIGTSTLAVLFLAMRSESRGQEAVTCGRRTIPRETVVKATAVLTLSAAFVGLVSWLLLLTQSTNLAEALFEAVSAFATCGFTLGLTTRLDLFGQLLLALTMFCGRLGVLTVVVAFNEPSGPRGIHYPEEKILIG